MDVPSMSLGLLVSVAPSQPNYRHAIGLAEAALRRGMTVYLYCLDDAVTAVGDARLKHLQHQGLKLWACAYAARKRHLPLDPETAYAGLGVLSDIMAGTNRFLGFH